MPYHSSERDFKLYLREKNYSDQLRRENEALRKEYESVFEDCDRLETWGREMRDHRGALLRALDLAAKAWRYAPHMGPRRSAERWAEVVAVWNSVYD